jgi:7,8-dihydropterin-6-yl-methyl-4-(beta-D-ribofuranosyl)aminobenzene 5'-phosphate synthase
MRLPVAVFACSCIFGLFPSHVSAGPPNKDAAMYEADREIKITLQNISLTILYDNNPYDELLDTGWGFSCLIKGAEKTILFDTGGSGSVLLNNMHKLGISPLETDMVVLSHIHGDHVGGLFDFLLENPDVDVYIPDSFPADFRNRIKTHKADVKPVAGPERICRGVYTTGPLGGLPPEQSLVIRTDGGLIVVTGCAHPGIVTIVENAKDLFPDEVLLVLGGFHLLGESRHGLNSVISRLRRLGVERAGPCHCTGDTARELFRREWEENYIDVGVGRVITATDFK